MRSSANLSRVDLARARVGNRKSTVKQQIRAELRTLMEFFRAAARQGLRLPEDSQDLRAELVEFDSVKETLFDAMSERKISGRRTLSCR